MKFWLIFISKKIISKILWLKLKKNRKIFKNILLLTKLPNLIYGFKTKKTMKMNKKNLSSFKNIGCLKLMIDYNIS